MTAESLDLDSLAPDAINIIDQESAKKQLQNK